MKSPKFLATLTAAVLMLTAAPLPASAEVFDEPQTAVSSACAEPDSLGSIKPADNLRAAGLISSYYVLCTGNTYGITFSSRTTGPRVVKKIGSIDIMVERSNDGVSGWSDFLPISDKTAEDASYHFLDSYYVSVPSGYYYRIRLTHYAKDYGWFFPETQAVTQTSVVVYVP